MKEVDIGSVVPYEFNNRRHSEKGIERIAKSIKEFGFNQPVVVDEENTILVGHGRLLAAQKLKYKKIPVLKKIGLTDEQKRAYRILDNSLNDESIWEFDNLSLELGFLEDQGFDLDSWGLKELLATIGNGNDDLSPTEDEGFECENKETFIQQGDIIELGAHTLYCADAASVKLKGNFDMLITDPPYGVDYEGRTKDKLKLKNDDLKEKDLETLFGRVFEAALLKLKSGGAIYLTAPPGPLSNIFRKKLIEEGCLRQELVWLKDSMVLGHSDYHYKHEPILYGWKKGGKRHFVEERDKVSVLEFSRPKKSTDHPTMKPVLLWAELIKNSSKKGEVVYDPFAGSGTTIIASEQLGRRAVCV